MQPVMIERTIAIVGGLVVAAISGWALYKDWKTPGIENQVFKLMLGLLVLGGVLALLAGAGAIGNFPKEA